MLALVQPAEARIVCTPAHKQLVNHKPFNLDLNHDGMNDFKFVLSVGRQTSFEYSRLGVTGVGKTDGIVHPLNSNSGFCAAALPKGTQIGPKRLFKTSGPMFFNSTYQGVGNYGCPWFDRQAYLGLKFSVNGKVHFGWARFVVKQAAFAELTGYAYETTPNKPIIAGKTKGTEETASETGTLAALARGAK